MQLSQQAVNGSDLRLTIDSGIQHILESQMYDTFTRNHARGATGIVMDVHTGAILAMATFPSYDANRYASANPSLYDNPAVARPYEPGSVMKAFTIAAALDAGAITTRTKVVDHNNLRIAGVRIQNADRFDHPWGHGAITPQQVLQLSNNNGAAKIGLKLGGERLYQAFRRFGFGQPTGIDIAGEVAGTVWNPRSRNASGDLTTAQNAFGQGLTVTAVQLVAGYAAIANGGTMVTPHVIAGWTDGSGTFHPTRLPTGERVMRPETSAAVMKLLLGAIDGGIAKGAQVPGYSIAGKTGTAEIAGPVKVRDASGKVVTRNRYIAGWIDSSFIGVYPASRPQLVTLILLHRPATWGRYVMSQRPEVVFHLLAPQILDYLAIPPDRRTAPVASPAYFRRVSRASDDPHREPAGRHQRPSPHPDRRSGLRGCQRRLTEDRPGLPLRRAAGRAAGWPHLRPCCPPRRSGGGPGGATGAAPTGDQRLPRPGGRPAHRAPGPGRMVAIAVSSAGGGDHRVNRQDDGQGDGRGRALARLSRPSQRGEPELGVRPAHDAAQPGRESRGGRP